MTSPENGQGEGNKFTGSENFNYEDMAAQPKAAETAIRNLSPQEKAINAAGEQASAAVRARNPRATEADLQAARLGTMKTARRVMGMDVAGADQQSHQLYADRFAESAQFAADKLFSPDLSDKERAEWTGHLDSHQANQKGFEKLAADGRDS